ncbi:peroxisomal 3-ketoacyl-CoA thiolase 3 [Artemisia annua]|uniref:Peroxisomal 3-ketoacyl-CoA thiolase 3 n=1 Tax=Artemisia annua TaxID=35608 RepID=A0A2U1Q9D5_ARTAN|nr:peroxisomal 3-ketoacyl-CoA thiolase 3 [Artemisia annua]
MRVKSKDVRRHSSDETLEGGASLGTHTSIGPLGSANDLNSCPVNSTVPQGSIDDGRLLVSDNGNWVGTLDVPGGLGTFMDVDHGLHCLNADVQDVYVRPSSVITINEPHSFGVTVTNTRRRFPIDVDATGKGKRKLDDAPTPLHDADVGAGSSTSSVVVVNAADAGAGGQYLFHRSCQCRGQKIQGTTEEIEAKEQADKEATAPAVRKLYTGTTEEIEAKALVCAAGHSSAYKMSTIFGDDVVVIAVYQTLLCKLKRGGLKDTYPDDILAKAVIEKTNLNPAEVGNIVVGFRL